MNPVFSEMARAVEDAANAGGYSVIVCNNDDDLEKERSYVELLLSKQVDVLVVAPAPGSHAFLKDMVPRRVPLVFVNRLPDDLRATAVVVDSAAPPTRPPATSSATGTGALPPCWASKAP